VVAAVRAGAGNADHRICDGNRAPYRNEKPPRREQLPGGAVLLEVPLPGTHSVTLGVWLRSGSRDEPTELGGVSHFLEHIVFKGSVAHTAYEIATGFDRFGVSVDAFTTKDHVAFTITVLPEYLEPAVALLADMILRPAFDPQLIALEQDVVCEEIQEALDTPEERLHDAFAARIYGAHARARPILGEPQMVRRFDAELLRREHARLFASGNLVIAMAGDIDARAHDVVLRCFTDLPAGGAVAPLTDDGRSKPTTMASPVSATDRRLALHSPIVQSYFEIGNLAVSYLDADRIPVVMLSNMLGGGMSSRVFQAVREREGLAYTVYNYNDMGRDIGLVSCAGCCLPHKQERLQKLVYQEYARLIADGPDQDELANNRAQLKSQLIFSLEGGANQMARAAKNEILYGRFVPITELVHQVDALGRDDLMRCAEAYFSPDRLLFASHGPA